MPAGQVCPSWSTTRRLTPVARPTDPCFTGARFGSGWLVAWCAVSVIPYADNTGAPKVRSTAWAVITLSGALQLRTNLNGTTCGPGYSRAERCSRISWMVGTAVNHVAATARMSPQNVRAENRPRSGSSTHPPLAREASSTASNP
jgi:hypothetical protein